MKYLRGRSGYGAGCGQREGRDLLRTGHFRPSPGQLTGMGRSDSRVSSPRAVARILRAAAVIAVGAAAFGALGYAGQGDRTGAPDFDPTKKGAWRFLDDDLAKPLTQGASAYGKGDYQTAARLYLTYLYRNGRDTRTIVNLARCYARMGNAEAAVEVLARAARAGFVNPSLLDSNEDLKPIRETRIFKDHVKQIVDLDERLGRTIGVIGPRVNRCRVRVPPSRVPGKAYPLVIGLHGNGGYADEMMQSLPPDAFPGMIVAAPDGVYPRDDLSFLPGGHYSWYMLGAPRALWPILDPPTSDYILAVVDEIAKICPVSKVILLGFSQGVSAAYMTALARPGRVAGVVAFAGPFPEELLSAAQIKAGNGIRIMIAHGTDDRQIELRESERARDVLKEAGYRVQFETFEGGHTLPPDTLRRAAEWIRSWL